MYAYIYIKPGPARRHIHRASKILIRLNKQPRENPHEAPLYRPAGPPAIIYGSVYIELPWKYSLPSVNRLQPLAGTRCDAARGCDAPLPNDPARLPLLLLPLALSEALNRDGLCFSKECGAVRSSGRFRQYLQVCSSGSALVWWRPYRDPKVPTGTLYSMNRLISCFSPF